MRLALKHNRLKRQFHGTNVQNIIPVSLSIKASQVSMALLAAGLKKGDLVLIFGVADIKIFSWFYGLTQIGLIYLFVGIHL